MSTAPRMMRAFIRSEDGAALAEYGLLIALIAAVAIVVVKTTGTKVSTAFENLNSNF